MTDICKLSDKKCGPCNKETPALSPTQVVEYLLMVPDWLLDRDMNIPVIKRSFKFNDFLTAMAFVNKMAVIFEEEEHHADFYLHHWCWVDVTLTTHAIDGLSENDFIVAAKIDTITV